MTGLALDASGLIAPHNKDSNLTSNVDSVMSYMGADKKDGSERSDAILPAADNSEYRVNLELLNAEVNNSVHSSNSIQRLKTNLVASKVNLKGGKKVGPSLMPEAQSTGGTNDVFAEIDSFAKEQI